MNDTLRNAGIILMIFVSAFVLYTVVNEVKQVDVEEHMQQLGQLLFDRVPEGEERDALAAEYNDYVEKIRNREVAPESVERVAAGILNLSGSKKTLAPSEAEAVLTLAVDVPRPIGLTKTPAAPKPAPSPNPERWKEVDERINAAMEFTKTVKAQENEIAVHDENEKPMFHVHPNLNIAMDMEMKDKLKHDLMEELAEKVRKLEEEKMLEWQENFEQVMEAKALELEAKMQKLEDEINRIEFNELSDGKKVLQLVSSLAILDSVGIPLPVDIDSILEEVGRELEDIDIQIHIE